ncbi:MAG: hypothetical protein ACFB5Z_16955 [Elainellaceae cyanobacterium]
MTLFRRLRDAIRYGAYAVLAALTLAAALDLAPGHPVAAQGIISTSQAAEQIYAQMPDLPLENHYESAETRGIAESSTLIRRLVRYHLFVQRRQPLSRLDWKLTLADYLGVNEWVTEPAYPGYSELEESPRNGDMNAVRSLTLAQRHALVEALVGVYRPD